MPPKKADATKAPKAKASVEKVQAKAVRPKPASSGSKTKRGVTDEGEDVSAQGSSPEAKRPHISGAVVNELVASLRDDEWREALAAEFAKPYFGEIAAFVSAERAAFAVHPPADLVFSAFNETPLSNVRVVLLGQDPYHEPGQAHGMCFSVLPGVTPPPSLKNMYKELETDIPGFKTPSHGHLLQWAKQGVLLLNATLTVREGHQNANSHSRCGWQAFTDEVIRIVNERARGVVFLLWGGFAQKKGKIVDTGRHRVIACAHPSPLSFKKWQGCKTFSKCNEELRALGHEDIDWCLGD